MDEVVNDIVEELDAELLPRELEGDTLLQRARDEIATLRHQKAELWDAMQTKLHAARADALEQAAGVCERNTDLEPWECAQIIRTLKAPENIPSYRSVHGILRGES